MNLCSFSTENLFILPGMSEMEQFYYPFMIPSPQEQINMPGELYLEFQLPMNLSPFYTTEETNWAKQDNPTSQEIVLPCEDRLRKKFTKTKGKKQKKGRNVISNIFRSFLRYLTSIEFLTNDFVKLTNTVKHE